MAGWVADHLFIRVESATLDSLCVHCVLPIGANCGVPTTIDQNQKFHVVMMSPFLQRFPSDPLEGNTQGHDSQMGAIWHSADGQKGAIWQECQMAPFWPSGQFEHLPAYITVKAKRVPYGQG